MHSEASLQKSSRKDICEECTGLNQEKILIKQESIDRCQIPWSYEDKIVEVRQAKTKEPKKKQESNR